jgi:hypothetical protein
MSKNRRATRQAVARMSAQVRRMRSIWLALALGFSVNLSVGVAVAQQDPTTIGAGQRPMVIILLDTSASMEFTTEGEGVYPSRAGSNSGGNLVTWSESALLNEGKHLRSNGLRANNMMQATAPTASGPELIGPCYVWEPVCSNYERPAWYPEKDLYPRNKMGPMASRLSAMRGTISAVQNGNIVTLNPTGPLVRMTNESQPRHVQLKEILTGDMILSPEISLAPGLSVPSEQLYQLLSPTEHAPGCWFVPRMHGARQGRDSWNICFDPNGNGGMGSFDPAPDNQSFNDFVDYIDPRPHFQEVHDRQLPTGLMDNMAGTVIFSVAMFDGFPGDHNGAMGIKPNSHALNDGMDHVDNIVLSGPFSNGTPTRTGSPIDQERPNNYNLGVHKVIGPATLDIGARPTLLPSLSRMVQLAIIDAGYLRNGDKPDWRIDPGKDDNKIKYTLPKELKDYVVPFQMGRQPIAAATPLAAAMRDIHKFFIGGQKAFKKDGSVSASANKLFDPENDPSVKRKDVDKDNYIHSPITTDPYQYCRAKHVVLMTDGFPQPEWGNGLGSDRLNDAYGYYNKDDQYPYATAETEIAALVGDTRINPPTRNGMMVDRKFHSRVHVVGLNVGEQAAMPGAFCAANDSLLNCQMRRKLGTMAKAGNTCAYYYLCAPDNMGNCQGEGKKYIPNTPGWPYKGTCNPATQNCLVQQLDSNEHKFYPPDTSTFSTNGFDCIAPALLLQQNDKPISAMPMNQAGTVRDDLTQALQFVLNDVINASGGVASRTRASVTNTLDQFLGGLPKTGQYRFYSGVDVGGGVFWKGLLNRQELACSGNGGVNSAQDDALIGPVSRPIHEDIAAQVKEEANGTFKDNRRIFSMRPLLDASQRLVQPTNQEGGLYPVSFELVRLPANQDEFVGAGIAPELDNANYLLGARHPFRLEALVGAVNPTVLNVLNSLISALNSGNIPVIDDAVYGPIRPILKAIFGTDELTEIVKVINTTRGTTADRRGRVLNAILNSNPVTVGPPELDVPVDSYRAFRARYANRPTMLYVSTLDGQLHAIHAGEMQNRVIVRDFVDVYGNSQSGEQTGAKDVIPGTTNKQTDPASTGVASQREAWAYVPHMLINKISQSTNRQPNLMDGTPVISDVRLCDGRANLNQNVQACRAFKESGTIDPEDQWRTVLVQGLGAAGAGYFALDITRAGGPTGPNGEAVVPQPIPLWEFNVRWEADQIKRLRDAGKQARYGSSLPLPIDPDTNMQVTDADCNENFSMRPFDTYSFLGLSVSEPAIGTVALHTPSVNAPVQRAVAVFSGGIKGDLPEHDQCAINARMGRAFYVVDMQTGSLLRRFVSYRDKTGMERRFDSEISGAPALFDATPGSVVSRGYVGDSKGRLYRINFNIDRNNDGKLEPEDWTLDLMFDPNDAIQGAGLRAQVVAAVPGLVNGADPINFGPASFRPAIALDANRQIVVVYGLGERGETSTAGQAQAMIALRERFDTTDPNKLDYSGDAVLWTHAFGLAEKLTGEPVIFNNGVYFTSFKEDPADRCLAGKSRIWGVSFLGAVAADGTPLKKIQGVMPLVLPDGTDLRMLAGNTGEDGVLYEEDNDNPGNAFWIGPNAPALIRGVTITLGPVCSVALDPTAMNQSFDSRQEPQPQLIAQTGGATPGNSAFGGRKDAIGGINRIVIPLRKPRTQSVPLSWANLGI